MEDYAGMFKRRFLLVVGCMLICLVGGIGVSYVIPPTYESQTLVLIQQQRVPEDYVKPVVDQDLGARLATMKEQILSRSRLEPIITRYNLFSGGERTMDDRIELIRKAIKVTQIRSDQAPGGMPGFFVTFQARDARTAQQVCGEITSLFVSENLSAREQSAEGTTDFLKQQLDDAKRTLDEQDEKLAAFQTKYLGKLPDQESSNTNTLQALTTQLDAATQSVNRIQQNETFLETMIAEGTRETTQTGSTTSASVDERQRELNSLIEQKKQLETLYTADYPDVLAISRKISKLQNEINQPSSEPQPKVATAAQHDSPHTAELRAQLRAVQQSLVPAKQEQARLQQHIRIIEERIEASPVVEQEYKKITRDHETALKFYNSLLSKMNESTMATALERRQQGEQFSVMDPPNLPDGPKFPNHLVFAGGGIASGLFLGFLIAALLEYRDTSVRSERDIWAFTKLPTLATVSHIDGLPSEEITQRSRLWNPFSRRRPIESAGS